MNKNIFFKEIKLNDSDVQAIKDKKNVYIKKNCHKKKLNKFLKDLEKGDSDK
ncbi:hypothetical protein [Haloplasma contractile]|uniref:hypothetical protein n=1 Tax=Haloplasma contractile TaxID=471825 RepID=UPI0002122555|nr:hypothetical protein [Haloplasma contractile]